MVNHLIYAKVRLQIAGGQNGPESDRQKIIEGLLIAKNPPSD